MRIKSEKIVHKIALLKGDPLVQIELTNGECKTGYPDGVEPCYDPDGKYEDAISLDYGDGSGAIIPNYLIKSFKVLE